MIIAILAAIFIPAGVPMDPLPPPAPLVRHTQMDIWLEQAGIPPALWPEFKAVAWCESEYDPTAVGDGGRALGLLQIHWGLWASWAESEGYGRFDRPYDAVQNIQLAHLIQKEYDMKRGRGRWNQWGSKPDWPRCRYGVIGE